MLSSADAVISFGPKGSDGANITCREGSFGEFVRKLLACFACCKDICLCALSSSVSSSSTSFSYSSSLLVFDFSLLFIFYFMSCLMACVSF